MASKMLIDLLLDQNPEIKDMMFGEYGFDDRDIIFIKELIDPEPLKGNDSGHQITVVYNMIILVSQYIKVYE